MKIGARTREYYRYTGASADLERRGAGCSRPELAWARKSKQTEDRGCPLPPSKIFDGRDRP